MENIIEEKMRWYVLGVTANKECSIKENLLKKISIYGLEKYIARVEVPMEKYLGFKNGKKVVKQKVLMSGYVLIQADASYGELQPIVKSISGVFGFLSTSEAKVVSQPIPIRDSELIQFLKEEVENDDISWVYDIGDSVKVLDGPFSGFDGIITDINDQKKMLNVIVNIFSRDTPVEIDFTKVEKIKT